MDDLAQLRKIQNILQELEFETQLFTTNETGSVDLLAVKISADEEETQSMAINFMPLADELEGSSFIQFYYEYPFLLQSPCPNELKTLIQNVNRQLPLGHFNTNVAWSQIYFKYVLANPVENSLTTGQLTDIMDMVVYSVQHFENEFSAFQKD